MLRPPRRLLIGLDPVHDDSPLIRRAAELGRRFDATLILFECVHNQYVSPRYFPDDVALDHARRSLVEKHRERLGRVAGPLTERGLKVATEAAWDEPHDESVVRAALRQEADWILVGVRYHPVRRLPFVASADWQLICNSPLPLLLVHPRTWSSPTRVVAAVDPLHRHGKPEDLDRRILEAGASVCRNGGGQLYVFHAFEPIVHAAVGSELEPLPVEYAEATLEGAHNAAVEALLDGLPEASGNVRIAEGSAAVKLPDFAEEIHADLVVMGAVARNPLQRIFIGSTAEKVLDRLACDILVIKPEGFVSPLGSPRPPFASA